MAKALVYGISDTILVPRLGGQQNTPNYPLVLGFLGLKTPQTHLNPLRRQGRWFSRASHEGQYEGTSSRFHPDRYGLGEWPEPGDRI